MVSVRVFEFGFLVCLGGFGGFGVLGFWGLGLKLGSRKHRVLRRVSRPQNAPNLKLCSTGLVFFQGSRV